MVSFLFQRFLFYMYFIWSACAPCACWCPQSPEGGSDPLELELQMAVTCIFSVPHSHRSSLLVWTYGLVHARQALFSVWGGWEWGVHLEAKGQFVSFSVALDLFLRQGIC